MPKRRAQDTVPEGQASPNNTDGRGNVSRQKRQRSVPSPASGQQSNTSRKRGSRNEMAAPANVSEDNSDAEAEGPREHQARSSAVSEENSGSRRGDASSEGQIDGSDKNVTDTPIDFSKYQNDDIQEIQWGSKRRHSPIWSCFAEGIDANPPHNPQVACLGCGTILSHPQRKVNKGNLRLLRDHLRHCALGRSHCTDSQAALEAVLEDPPRRNDIVRETTEFSLQDCKTAAIQWLTSNQLPIDTFEQPETQKLMELIRKTPAVIRTQDLLSILSDAAQRHSNSQSF